MRRKSIILANCMSLNYMLDASDSVVSLASGYGINAIRNMQMYSKFQENVTFPPLIPIRDYFFL